MLADWQAAGLIKVSVFKPVIATIEQGLVVRVMGQLSGPDLTSLREIVGRRIG